MAQIETSSLRRIFIPAAFAMLGWGSAFASKDFQIQGRLGLGAGQVQEGEIENHFETRLGFKTKRKNGARAYVELRADEGSRDVSLQDSFLDWRNDEKTSRIRAGRGKKILGWEYDYPTSDRLSIRRTLTYDFLANRQLVGRDYFIGYQWTRLPPANEESPTSDLDSSVGNPAFLIDPTETLKLGADFHYNESRDSAIILSASTLPSAHLRFGAWASIQWNRGQFDEVTRSLSSMLSALFEIPGHRVAAECYFGDDPYRTQVEHSFGEGRNVRAVSLKGEYGAYLGDFNPYIVGTVLWKDLANRGDRTDERIVGLRYFFSENLNLAGEYLHRENRSTYDTTSESYSYKTFALLGRYYF